MKKLARILAEEGLIKTAGKNGYIAFYKGKRMEVMADTSLEARDLAAKKFRAKKPYEVEVVLAEKDGKQVSHKPLMASSLFDLGDGRVVTKAEMMDRAIAKEMVLIGYSKPVLKFHAILEDKDADTASVVQIGKRDFDRLRVPDRTSSKTRAKVKQMLLDKQLDKLIRERLSSMQDRLDFNMWVKQTNPTVDEKIAWLKSR